MVGLVENALVEIKDKYHPDRILIESSGSAFPATLALQIRELEPQGFKLDGVVTVIDCVNFRGYEDNSPTAKLQAQYTDLLLLSKHELCSERDMDILLDRLFELNDGTPHVKVGADAPLRPDLVFGLDSKLFLKGSAEADSWAALGGQGPHIDEVETKSVWRGGSRPGKKHEHKHGDDACKDCAAAGPSTEAAPLASGEVTPVTRDELEGELKKLAHASDVYRVKGIVRFPSPAPPRAATPGTPADTGARTPGTPHETHVLNWAFGRHELTRTPALDESPDLEGVGLRLTVMGERGEVGRRARKLAEGLEAEVA